jgi:hypothetical protein
MIFLMTEWSIPEFPQSQSRPFTLLDDATIFYPNTPTFQLNITFEPSESMSQEKSHTLNLTLLHNSNLALNGQKL